MDSWYCDECKEIHWTGQTCGSAISEGKTDNGGAGADISTSLSKALLDKYEGWLWADCSTDIERAEFIECGKAHATGVIAPAIAQDVAEAFRFRAISNAPHNRGE